MESYVHVHEDGTRRVESLRGALLQHLCTCCDVCEQSVVAREVVPPRRGVDGCAVRQVVEVIAERAKGQVPEPPSLGFTDLPSSPIYRMKHRSRYRRINCEM